MGHLASYNYLNKNNYQIRNKEMTFSVLGDSYWSRSPSKNSTVHFQHVCLLVFDELTPQKLFIFYVFSANESALKFFLKMIFLAWLIISLHHSRIQPGCGYWLPKWRGKDVPVRLLFLGNFGLKIACKYILDLINSNVLWCSWLDE